MDASQYGLMAVLLQDDRPIKYSSIALSETQQRYIQIEKELLAVVFMTIAKKCHYYLFKREFTILKVVTNP